MPPTRATRKVNPNMLDVARHAGVSIATVSNVINRPEKVSPKTTERVRASIAELGFVRNDAARSLAVGSSKSLGLVLADIENSLFIDMAHGAQQASNESGLRLLLGNTLCDLRQQDEYLDLFDEARVAGLLLAPMEDSSEGIRRMRSHGRQIVLLNYSQKDVDCCTVLVDNEMVGYMAARHLLDAGCLRLAFAATDDHLQPVQDRRAGIVRAVAEAGPAASLDQFETGGLDYDHGTALARRLLARDRPEIPDGIISVSDALGHGIIQGFEHHSDLRVPDDISVIGCEDNRSASTGRVPLTTVHPPGVEMGAQAVAFLLEEIQTHPDAHEHRTVVFQPSLVVRSSTAPTTRAALLTAS